MIELISYQGLNGLKFGDSIERANQLFGAPLTERKSKGGEIVQHRKGFILRFSSPDKAFSEGVVPCGENVMLDGTLIDWSSVSVLKFSPYPHGAVAVVSRHVSTKFTPEPGG